MSSAEPVRGSHRAGKSSPVTRPPERVVSADWVDSSSGVREVRSAIVAAGEYCLDTEFHRERTYFPRLALVQIAVGDRIWLIDPLSITSDELAELFDTDALAVLHAAQQDLDVLTQSCGVIPKRLFDTQLCAGFVGFSTPSLASLLSTLLKITAAKGDRLTDWLRRPLSSTQREYAATDVAYLAEIRTILESQLREKGRLEWALDACEELRTRPVGPVAPSDAWLRVKDVRTLSGRARWVARAVAEWREHRAMELDIPPRHVLSDLAILGIAQRAPRTPDDLADARGIDAKQAHGALGAAVLAAVKRGVSDADVGELRFPVPEGDDLDRALRPAVTLVSAWVAELARRESIDTALLATRQDIVDLLREAPKARLGSGWRAEILGNDVRQLLEGRMGLTFQRDGGRSGLSLLPVTSQ